MRRWCSENRRTASTPTKPRSVDRAPTDRADSKARPRAIRVGHNRDLGGSTEWAVPPTDRGFDACTSCRRMRTVPRAVVPSPFTAGRAETWTSKNLSLLANDDVPTSSVPLTDYLVVKLASCACAAVRHLQPTESCSTPLEVLAHERYEDLLRMAKVINQACIDHRAHRRSAQGTRSPSSKLIPRGSCI